MPDDSFPIGETGGIPVVQAPEEVDVTNASGLRAALLEASARGNGRYVVDMSHTEFCDTAGIHALVSAHKRAETEGGDIRLVITGAAVLRIFAITGLDTVLPYFASLDEALAEGAWPGARPAAGG